MQHAGEFTQPVVNFASKVTHSSPNSSTAPATPSPKVLEASAVGASFLVA